MAHPVYVHWPPPKPYFICEKKGKRKRKKQVTWLLYRCWERSQIKAVCLSGYLSRDSCCFMLPLLLLLLHFLLLAISLQDSKFFVYSPQASNIQKKKKNRWQASYPTNCFQPKFEKSQKFNKQIAIKTPFLLSGFDFYLPAKVTSDRIFMETG